jgi:hypothetical protein
MASIKDLPTELVLHIQKQLQPHELTALARANKPLHSLTTELLYKSPEVDYGRLFPFLRAISHNSAAATTVKNLSLTDYRLEMVWNPFVYPKPRARPIVEPNLSNEDKNTLETAWKLLEIQPVTPSRKVDVVEMIDILQAAILLHTRNVSKISVYAACQMYDSSPRWVQIMAPGSDGYCGGRTHDFSSLKHIRVECGGARPHAFIPLLTIPSLEHLELVWFEDGCSLEALEFLVIDRPSSIKTLVLSAQGLPASDLKGGCDFTVGLISCCKALEYFSFYRSFTYCRGPLAVHDEDELWSGFPLCGLDGEDIFDEYEKLTNALLNRRDTLQHLELFDQFMGWDPKVVAKDRTAPLESVGISHFGSLKGLTNLRVLQCSLLGLTIPRVDCHLAAVCKLPSSLQELWIDPAWPMFFGEAALFLERIPIDKKEKFSWLRLVMVYEPGPPYSAPKHFEKNMERLKKPYNDAGIELSYWWDRKQKGKAIGKGIEGVFL